MNKIITKLLILLCSVFSLDSFSQNVGIGTNNPLSKLHVAGAIRSDTLIYVGPGVRTLFAAPNGRIYDSLAVPSALSWEINGNSNITAAHFLGTTNASNLVFKTNNVEAGRILAGNGYMGLGSTAPTSRLEVGAIGGDGITIKATTGVDAGDLMFFDAAGVEKGRVYSNPLAASGLILSGGTVPAAHVFINNLGNVGVGNSAPNNRVEITSAAANTSGLRFTNLTSASPTVAANGKALSVDVNGDVVLMPSASDAWKLLGNAGTVAGTNFLGTTDAQDLVFKTNNLERMRTLASSGNVGIAITTPDARLHIHNDFGVNGTENPILILEQNGVNANNGCSIEFKNDGAGYNSSIAGLDDGGNDGRLEFRTNDDNMVTTAPLTSADTKMIILQNGNVGINTLAPSEKFHVIGNAQIGDVLPATGTGNYLTFSNTANNTDVLSLFRTNTLVDESTLNVSIGDNFGQGVGIDRFNVGAYLAGPALNNIFTVTSQGRAGIGQYNPAALLHITQPAISGTPIAIYESAGMTFNAFINTTFGGYTNPAGILYWELGGSETYMFGGEVVPDGDGVWNLGASTKRWNTVFATNGTINTSDARLKKDITGLSYGLNDLLKLQPVEYNWKDESLKGHCPGKNLGFLAQDVEKVIPNVVYTPKDDKEHYGVNYEALIPVLTKSIQELNQKLEEKTAELKASNDTYQAQINELKKMIEELKK